MIELTENAAKNLKSYMKEHNIDSAVRIAMQTG